ncbi:unnamed protein product [Ectocarpus sp. CCAP 1310/34]|nr:unnamed protein product [Ectocarpus sp. CCAP 1310/34]
MRSWDAVVAGLLLCACSAPTGESFHFPPSSRWTSWSSASSSHSGRSATSSADVPAATTRRSSRHHSPRRSRRISRRSSKIRMAEDGATAATQQQYTAQDLEALSRSELQGLCKKLNLRAVGKTSELLSRVLESDDHARREKALGTKPATTESTASSSPKDEAPMGESTMAELLSSVDDGGNNTNYSSGSQEKATPTPTAAAAGAAAPSTDFFLEDIRPVFDELSDEQWAKVGQLGQLLTEWNGKMNLISRKDIANVMPRHVVPCLAMAKALDFEDGTYGEMRGAGEDPSRTLPPDPQPPPRREYLPSLSWSVLDVGTGGGLPGLPLAICFPMVKFTLIDGRGKKIKAVADMADRLGLRNVRTFHVRAEEVYEAFDFVMGRAVTNLPKFVGFIDKNLKPNDGRTSNPADSSSSSSNNSLKRGILYMRGEVSEEELAELGARPSTVIPLQRVLEEAGQDGDVGLGGGADDRGYSSIFHFTSEAIWNRVPIASSGGASE